LGVRMADRTRKHGSRTAERPPGGPRSRGRRRGIRPLVYATTAFALVAILAAAWLLGRSRGPTSVEVESGGTPASAATTATGATRVETATPVEPTAPPKPSSAANTDSRAIVKAAAVRYPDPPAVDPQSMSSVKTDRKLVAITLDDGAGFDTRLLDLFEQRGVTCTTFVLGTFAAHNPQLMRRLNADGFEIANHSWDHPILTGLSDAEVRGQLSRAQEAISKVTGDQAPYMRPPGGGTSDRVKRIAASMGYRVVLWNRSFADTSKYATPDRLFHNVMDDLKPGDIVLCHWGGRSTYEAMRLILPEMERRGFTPVPLSVLLRYRTGSSAATQGVPGY
jgi:peptidoglycan/xylan/chitin deacetylase (PgdA/CDA1 family)